MTGDTRRSAAVAIAGIGLFAAVVIWFGIVVPQRPTPPAPSPRSEASPPPNAAAPATALSGPAPSDPPAVPPTERPAAERLSQPQPPPQTEAPALETPKVAEPPAAKAPAPAETPKAAETGEAGKPILAPSFDVVRVEPNGESVIAGRSAPGATIELMREGERHARAVADPSGLFALVPPPLPPGSHEIVLQSIAPTGERATSNESVTVVIDRTRTTRPLVALTAPDKPTVLLSTPEPPAKPAREAPAPAPATAAAQPSPPQAARAAPPAPQLPSPRAPVRVVGVEAEEGGRLFVSGQAAPGATVRLYLNETLVAPGGAGADGRISFVIGRGVRPGDYRVRLDDVDPVSGEVKTRAEVSFAMRPGVEVPLPPEAKPMITGPGRPADPALAPTAAARSEARPAGGAPEPSRQSAAAPAPRPAPAPRADPVGEPGPPSAPDPARTAAPGAPRGPARLAVAPREFDPGLIVVPEISTAMVARGDNLWRISRRVYGRGIRYTVIFGANQEQIRNPRWIYPGQVFVLPSEPEQSAGR